MTTYLLAGGGTAGHVNPLLAVADRIREIEADAEVLVLGTKEGLEARLVPERGYELLTIARLPFPRRPSAGALRYPGRVQHAVAEIREMIRDRGVDVVVGFGGYASAPAYLAAAREKVPLVVHEANARPGMANRLGSWLTRYVGVVHSSTRLRHKTVVGMPLRKEIATIDRPAARVEAAAAFALEPGKPLLLVTGGSTGARHINATVLESITAILGAGWQVLHITGEKSDLVDPGFDGYRVIRYCDRMDLAIAAADLAVARSGSGTVSEFSAVGVPAVYVPYPVGNGEQRFNAADVLAARGAVLVLDADFTPAWVSSNLVPLLNDRALIAEMAARTLASSVKDGTGQTVALIQRAMLEAASSQQSAQDAA